MAVTLAAVDLQHTVEVEKVVLVGGAVAVDRGGAGPDALLSCHDRTGRGRAQLRSGIAAWLSRWSAVYRRWKVPLMPERPPGGPGPRRCRWTRSRRGFARGPLHGSIGPATRPMVGGPGAPPHGYRGPEPVRVKGRVGVVNARQAFERNTRRKQARSPAPGRHGRVRAPMAETND